MTRSCSVCRYEDVVPGFDLGWKCMQYAQGDDDITRVPTSQLVFTFRGRPLFGPLEVVQAAERYL